MKWQKASPTPTHSPFQQNPSHFEFFNTKFKHDNAFSIKKKKQILLSYFYNNSNLNLILRKQNRQSFSYIISRKDHPHVCSIWPILISNSRVLNNVKQIKKPPISYLINQVLALYFENFNINKLILYLFIINLDF